MTTQPLREQLFLADSLSIEQLEARILEGTERLDFERAQDTYRVSQALGKMVTEKPVDFVGFDNVVDFNKNRQNDDNVVKAYKS